MRVALGFCDEPLEFEIEERRLAGIWTGPSALDDAELVRVVRDCLEEPRGLPPLREAVVAGDRVAIPFDAELDCAGLILSEIVAQLTGAGVERSDIVVLPLGREVDPRAEGWPEGLVVQAPDPQDRASIAYLASTAEGRRIYLARSVTDADFVVPVGVVRYEPGAGVRGPWSTLFPGMSDEPTQAALRSDWQDATAKGRTRVESAQQAEADEVSWLLGCLYHVAVLPASRGVAEVLVGAEKEVRTEGLRALDRLWTFRTGGEADVVVAGVGRPGRRTGLADLACALRTARAVSRPGARTVLLSRALGPLGPAMGRLAGLADPGDALSVLEGAEGEEDYAIALAVAESLANGPVYLMSELDEETVEDLGIVPLGRPSEALRVIERGNRCLVIDQADRTRIEDEA